MSGAPIISGTIQLPKPPIIAGMTMKKIMISPCAVTNDVVVVRLVEESAGRDTSARRGSAIDSVPPIRPANSANTRYIVPMSLWFVE